MGKKKEQIEEPVESENQLLQETRQELPWADSQMPKTVVPDGEGAMTLARPRMPARFEADHQMAVGLKEAKKCIARILADATNLAELQLALETEFHENPPGFLRRYEPLLRRYEQMKSSDAPRPIRILADGKNVAIEVPSNE